MNSSRVFQLVSNPSPGTAANLTITGAHRHEHRKRACKARSSSSSSSSTTPPTLASPATGSKLTGTDGALNANAAGSDPLPSDTIGGSTASRVLKIAQFNEHPTGTVFVTAATVTTTSTSIISQTGSESGSETGAVTATTTSTSTSTGYETVMASTTMQTMVMSFSSSFSSSSSSSAASQPSSGSAPNNKNEGSALGSKKGASFFTTDTYVDKQVGKAAKDLHASWIYNWAADPLSIVGGSPLPGIEAIPMFWDLKTVTDEYLNCASVHAASAILAYNEPTETDMGLGQAIVPVAEAVASWPKLRSTGKRVGSPAPAYTNTNDPQDWFVRFMKAMGAAGQEVDFVALHFYDNTLDVAKGVENLVAYVKGIHATYGKPIWVTEYAMIKFGGAGPEYPTLEVQAQFAEEASKALAAMEFVERFAWFATPLGKEAATGANWHLMDGQGAMTSVGKSYAGV